MDAEMKKNTRAMSEQSAHISTGRLHLFAPRNRRDWIAVPFVRSALNNAAQPSLLANSDIDTVSDVQQQASFLCAGPAHTWLTRTTTVTARPHAERAAANARKTSSSTDQGERSMVALFAARLA